METMFFKSFFCEVFLSLTLLLILVYDSRIVTSTKHNFPLLDKDTFVQALFVLFCCLCIQWNTDFGGADAGKLFCNDVSALSSKVIILASMGCALLVGQNYFVSSRLNLFEFFLINLLATLSLLVLVSATDLLPLYLAIEMQSLSFYILASFNKYSAFSTEAGLKYFVLGAFVSGFFLFGSSLLYGATGSTNFFSYSLLFSEGFDYDLRKTILLLGIFFLLIVFLFKISAAPFHIWSPDVYEGAPLSSTLVFVLVPKLVLFLLIFRLLYFSFPTFLADFQPVLLLSGVLSVLLGSLMAIRQKRLKRLLVYSSISHVGFLLLGCASGTVLGLTSILYYIIFYIITNTLVWGVLALMHSYTGAPVYLSDLSTLSRINPALAITFCLGLFSLAGIPPLVGFSMKFFIFHSAMSAALYPLSWLILMLSAVGSFYYLRIIKIVYFEYIGMKEILTSPTLSEALYPLISFCFFLVVFAFFHPDLSLLLSFRIALGMGSF